MYSGKESSLSSFEVSTQSSAIGVPWESLSFIGFGLPAMTLLVT